MYSSEIEAKVSEFVGKNAMFTSVDIGNSIKKDGTWLKNSEVAKWLRNNVTSLHSSYASTKISVMQGQHTATLYHPASSDPDDYQDRDQQAFSPSHTQSITATVASVPPKKFKLHCDTRARLRIPAHLVVELGWKPGDKVNKSKILVNNKDLKDDLIVHKDGRISIPRECIAWGDGPINTFINNNNNLCFEKI